MSRVPSESQLNTLNLVESLSTSPLVNVLLAE